MAKKKAGTTTFSAAGGGTFAGLVAVFLVEAFQWDLSETGVAGLAAILTLAGAFIGGYLAPSVQEKIDSSVADHMSKVRFNGEPTELLGDRPAATTPAEPIPEATELPADDVVPAGEIKALDDLRAEDYEPAHASPATGEVEPAEELDGTDYPDLGALAESK